MAVLPPAEAPSTPLPTHPADLAWPTAEWPTATMGSQLTSKLNALLGEAFADQAKAEPRFGQSLALVVVHRGRLVAERYGPDVDLDTQLISWSMAKSFTHALIGLMVEQGDLVLDTPAPVDEWQSPDDPRHAITVDHLLRMVSGLEFNEDYVEEATSHCLTMLFGDGQADMAAYTASQSLIAPPGTVFNYASGTTVILCRILADLIGRGPAFERWMKSSLLDPLGIEARLSFDDAGTWVGSSFLHASARDFARFGLLYCRDGQWADGRLLPSGWVDYARTPRAVDDEDGSRYGAHWWIWPRATDVFFASGYETQRIIVDPGSDLVIVRLGKTPTELAPNVDAWLEQIRSLVAQGD